MKHIVLLIWMLLGFQVGSILFYGNGGTFFGAVNVSEDEFFQVEQRNIGAELPGIQVLTQVNSSVVLKENNAISGTDFSATKAEDGIRLEQKLGELFGSEFTTWVKYPEHLAGPFTGGFGEESCHSCHFDYDLNMPDGVLELSGMPEIVEPGKIYELVVIIGRPDLGAAGFQLTSRFEDGSQAGAFTLNDAVILTPNTPGETQYVQHAVKNISPIDGQKVWKFTWIAPKSVNSGPIIVNLAGNAANGDESAFEDWILLSEYRVEVGD